MLKIMKNIIIKLALQFYGTSVSYKVLNLHSFTFIMPKKRISD